MKALLIVDPCPQTRLVLTPFLAPRVASLGARVLLHVLGLASALLAGWGATFAMLFTIFSERVAAGVGWLVLGAFAAAIIDALLRLGWSAQEWWRARRAALTPGASS